MTAAPRAAGDRVDVTAHVPGVVPVRDGKNPGPVLVVRAGVWAAFVGTRPDAPQAPPWEVISQPYDLIDRGGVPLRVVHYLG
ncbi:DUF397 domain-containing protein [Streptomyces sp. NPDC088752]|uniref:DUF397 domain-containing protein n=1 Tax=Streptomyces sp. NPDC088752 TaxID=3154963 RepID=UPI0034278B2F